MRKDISLMCKEVRSGEKIVWGFYSNGIEVLRLSDSENPHKYKFESGKQYKLTFVDGVPEAMLAHDHWCDWELWLKEIK